MRQHEMCPTCDHCRHCSRARVQIMETFLECAGSPPHRHLGPPEFRGPPWMEPNYVPEWALPLARSARDAA